MERLSTLAPLLLLFVENPPNEVVAGAAACDTPIMINEGPIISLTSPHKQSGCTSSTTEWPRSGRRLWSANEFAADQRRAMQNLLPTTSGFWLRLAPAPANTNSMDSPGITRGAARTARIRQIKGEELSSFFLDPSP